MNATISASVRENRGKGAAHKIRATGKIPGVVYGQGNAATAITFDPIALLDIFRKSLNRNTVVHVDIDGTVVPTLVREAQRHPVSRELLHVDFYRVADDVLVTVKVPVRAVGRPAGASIGGRVELVRRDLTVSCTYDRIPEFVDVDVRALEVGDVVKVAQIPATDGFKIVFDKDFPVLGCVGKKK